jgi:hypothetical protein
MSLHPSYLLRIRQFSHWRSFYQYYQLFSENRNSLPQLKLFEESCRKTIFLKKSRAEEGWEDRR